MIPFTQSSESNKSSGGVRGQGTCYPWDKGVIDWKEVQASGKLIMSYISI